MHFFPQNEGENASCGMQLEDVPISVCIYFCAEWRAFFNLKPWSWGHLFMHKYIKFDKIAKKSRHPQEKVTYIYIYIYIEAGKEMN
jgi:hypothetical protein